MNFARVTGTVVCTQKLDCLAGQKLLVIQPLDEHLQPQGRELVATDVTSAGPGEIVFYETGREAALAMEDTWNVADAAVTAIVDSIDEEPLPGTAATPQAKTKTKVPADLRDITIVETSV